MSILKTFEVNTKGRDFVVGDIHGALDVFANLIDNINFDPTVDRMFSVGDLVDRGPQSQESLALIREPWFHAVLANHEQMMLHAFRGGESGSWWIPNGGHWGFEALVAKRSGTIIDEKHAELLDLIEQVAEMPYIMTIQLKDRKVHVLHAELPPMSGYITDEDLANEEIVQKLATAYCPDGESFLWSRFIYMNFYRRDLNNEAKVKRTIKNGFDKDTEPFNPKLSHIISGHTILQRPMTILGQTNIDTCAYGSMGEDASKWMGLTCIELEPWKFYKATATTFEEVQPFVFDEADLFGEMEPEKWHEADSPNSSFA